MPDRLELELRELARELEFPQAPDVSARVGERLRTEPAPRRPRFAPPRRTLVIALAVLALALATALAVPPVRGALLDLFHIGGVTVERVETLPPVTNEANLHLGRRTTLPEARRSVDFPILVPGDPKLGAPDRVFRSSAIPGGAVSLLYGTQRDPRLLVTAFRGTTGPDLVKKTFAGATEVRPVDVRGTQGYFITGAPHAVVFRDRTGRIREDEYRLAKDVLLWVAGTVTYRLEGDLTEQRALAIAEGMR
jgi:hypothetical protein